MTAPEKILNNEGIVLPCKTNYQWTPSRFVPRKPSDDLNLINNVGEETPQPASAGNYTLRNCFPPVLLPTAASEPYYHNICISYPTIIIS